jgi:hypothetical protein
LVINCCPLQQEIKRSYRKLAKVYHPDVAKNEDDGATFLRLTDAYEFLLARIHGKDPDSDETNAWDWHDWYWNFRIKRTWEKQQNASESQSKPPVNSGAANPQAKAAVASQLAGLRQRAAIRSTAKAAESPPAAPEPSVSEQECEEVDEDQPCVLPDPPSHIITISTFEEDDEDEEPVFRDEGENFSSSCGARARPRRVFVASSGDRENLVGQLHGLKRRASLAQQQQGSAGL